MSGYYRDDLRRQIAKKKCVFSIILYRGTVRFLRKLFQIYRGIRSVGVEEKKLNVSGTSDVGTQCLLDVRIIMFGWCASGVHPRRRPGDPRRPPGPPGRAHPPRLVDPRRALLYKNGLKISKGKDAILIREKNRRNSPCDSGFPSEPSAPEKKD